MDKDTTKSVHAELDRMLDSEAFKVSKRNRDFLSFVVAETLAGRDDRIKAYTIATSVYGRSEGFDPQVDPIVRVEAQRIRRAIELYHLTDKKSDGIRISMPKGSYVPVFENHDFEHPVTEPVESRSKVRCLKPVAQISPTILVTPFNRGSVRTAFPSFTSGFTRQIVVGLYRFTDIIVFGPETPEDFQNRQPSSDLPVRPKIDYIVSGSTMVFADRFSIEAIMTNARTGQVLWGQTYDRDVQFEDFNSAWSEVANAITRTLAEPWGVIFSDKALACEGKPPTELGAFDSVIRFYQHMRHIDQDSFQQAAVGLEIAVARQPVYAEAIACLSQIYTHSYRFDYRLTNNPSDLMARALELARRAVELAPQSSRSFHALALAYWFTGDLPASLNAYMIGLDLNPNSTELMAELGLRKGMMGEYDEGISLLQKAFERSPALIAGYRIGLSAFFFALGKYDEAVGEARKSDVPRNAFMPLCEAAALIRLNRRKEANEAVQRLLEISPNYGAIMTDDLLRRQLDPDLTKKLVEALREAGLPMEDQRNLKVVGCRPA